MRILYVGELHPPYLSTCFLRMRAIGELGHEIHSLCIIPYHRWGGKFAGAPFRKLKWGPPLSCLNRDLLKKARECKPELLWVDKGTWIYPQTLVQIRRECNALLIHYTPDPAIVYHATRHFLRSIPLYDRLVTTKSYEIDLYKRHGAKNLLLQPPCFEPRVHRPVQLTQQDRTKYGSDVVFVGTYAKGRERYLAPLCRSDLDVAIWGSGWLARCPDSAIVSQVRGEALGEKDLARGLCGAKIALGLLSPVVPDRTTTRSVEIPACGAFLLAERTEEHRLLFKEGQEAEFFGSADELIDKARYYLKHEELRQRIAAAGRERCLKSGYSMHDRMQEIIGRAQQASAEESPRLAVL